MIDPNKLTVSEYKRLFEESKNALGEHLAETRTNNNLFQGHHFAKKASRINRALEREGVNEDVKIRVTKNHINTVCKFIINSILSQSPTGSVAPKNPNELQDQKAAEIHRLVLEDYKFQNKIKKKIRSWAHDYVVSGEIFLNVFWDPNLGRKITPSPYYDLATGQTLQKAPFFSGDAATERIFPWDMRMDANAKCFEEAAWVGYEKMVNPDVIKKMFGNHPDIDKAIKSDADDTYKIFEAHTGTYKEAKDKVLLRQMYLRPCLEYPNGLVIFFTKEIELYKAPLPVDKNGNVFWPIKYLGFDEIPTSPRHASIIRQIRPEQMEVNRCASAMAQTQMTVGFDKMVVSTGGTVEEGGTKAGVRILKVPGGKQSADYIQGRSGEQFLATMQQNISEIYSKTGVPENWEEKNQDTDIMATLYKNMRQKTRFSLYGEKFSEFLVEVFEEILRLKKAYMTDEEFFLVTGKAEYQNISEFRSLDDLRYQIKIEEGTDDLESKFGRYMVLTNVLQYVGNNMDDNTKGLVLRNLPFANGEEITSKLTQQYDNAKNIMLALDRGEDPPVSEIADPLYVAEQLNNRIFKPDFRYLSPDIQARYKEQVAEYNQIYVEKLRAVERARQGFIPTEGPTVPVDGMYETDPLTGKTKRVQMPLSTLNWVIEQMKAQGQAMGNIQSLPLGQQAQIANQYMSGMSPDENQMPVPQY